jgi:hypothetical protein
MAAHIVNCSVDAPDLLPKDLTYNEMESVFEIVFEKVLHIENAVPEHQEQGNEDSGLVNLKKDFSFFSPFTFKIIPRRFAVSAFTYGYYLENYSNQFHPELTPPPPKA